MSSFGLAHVSMAIFTKSIFLNLSNSEEHSRYMSCPMSALISISVRVGIFLIGSGILIIFMIGFSEINPNLSKKRKYVLSAFRWELSVTGDQERSFLSRESISDTSIVSNHDSIVLSSVYLRKNNRVCLTPDTVTGLFQYSSESSMNSAQYFHKGVLVVSSFANIDCSSSASRRGICKILLEVIV